MIKSGLGALAKGDALLVELLHVPHVLRAVVELLRTTSRAGAASRLYFESNWATIPSNRGRGMKPRIQMRGPTSRVPLPTPEVGSSTQAVKALRALKAGLLEM